MPLLGQRANVPGILRRINYCAALQSSAVALTVLAATGTVAMWTQRPGFRRLEGKITGMFRNQALLVVLILPAMTIAGGCSEDPNGRHAVSGTVKFDGAPLKEGNISFQPTEGQPTYGGATITDGKYSVPQEQGLVNGKYQVSINSPVPGTGGKPAPDAMPGDPPALSSELIPPNWNVASDHFIEIKKEGPFTFDFDIVGKKK
jgi:hypothetical protein